MTADASVVLELTKDSFASSIDGHPFAVVDFWAPWCGPCLTLEPLVRDLAERYDGRLTVATLNVDQHPRSAGRYDVLSLPTLILFKGGRPVERIAGSVKATRLESAVAAHVDP